MMICARFRALCKDYPDTYWRELDARRGIPRGFVKVLTEAGSSSRDQSQRRQLACRAQRYTMGALLRHGSDALKREYLPLIAAGELRLQAFGVSERYVTSLPVRS
jgi:acyl-CoA dehydrogenase